MTRDISAHLPLYQYSGISLISFVAGYSVNSRSPPLFKMYVTSCMPRMQDPGLELRSKKYILGGINVR